MCNRRNVVRTKNIANINILYGLLLFRSLSNILFFFLLFFLCWWTSCTPLWRVVPLIKVEELDDRLILSDHNLSILLPDIDVYGRANCPPASNTYSAPCHCTSNVSFFEYSKQEDSLALPPTSPNTSQRCEQVIIIRYARPCWPITHICYRFISRVGWKPMPII